MPNFSLFIPDQAYFENDAKNTWSWGCMKLEESIFSFWLNLAKSLYGYNSAIMGSLGLKF